MMKIIIESLNAIFFCFFLCFYWVGKNQENFIGLRLFEFSTAYFLFLSSAQLIRIIFKNVNYKIKDLYFPIIFLLVPCSGLLGSSLGDIIDPDWRRYLDESMGDIQNYSGFRSPLVIAITYLLAAPLVADFLTKRSFLICILLSSVVHLFWGFSQVLYLYKPEILHSLPILVGSYVGQNFNLIIIRASGLMVNAFPYSWFFIVSSLAYLIISRNKTISLALLFISWLSISRAFIAATLPMLLVILSRINRITKLLIALLFLFLFFIFYDEMLELLNKRLEGDISGESRFNTNLMALKEFFGGNFFGIGYSHSYYTDGSYSYHLLSSGILGLVLYIFAWYFFFKRLWIKSSQSIEVISFAITFFFASAFVATVEAQPGVFLLFVLFWYLDKRGVAPPLESERVTS